MIGTVYGDHSGSNGPALQRGQEDRYLPDISDEEAIETARRLAREEGLLCGISSGTNVAAALRLAKKLGPSQRGVTILPDTGARYFSTPLFEP